MITMILIALIALVVGYIVYVRPFLESKGWVRQLPAGVVTTRDRLCAFVRSSLTILWGWLLMLWGGAVSLSGEVATWMGDPSVQAQLQSLLSVRAFAIAVIAIGGITILVRMRTAKVEGS